VLGRGLFTLCMGVGAMSVEKADDVYSCVRVVYEYVFHWWLSEIILFLAVFLIILEININTSMSNISTSISNQFTDYLV